MLLGFDPISKHNVSFLSFFFQNPHFVVDDDSTSLTPGGQDGGSRCESIACAEIRKGGWLQELPVVESQSNRLVFRGVSSSPRFLDGSFFFLPEVLFFVRILF